MKMIKMLYCIKRPPGMSGEDFNAYWHQKHAPLVAKLAPSLGLKKYIQTRALDIPFNEILQRSRGLGERYQGAAELWWDSVDEMIDALGSPDGLDANMALMKDEANFIDFASSSAWICEDHAIYESD